MSRRNQSGNVFFALLAAVGLVGVLGASLTTFITGPAATMVTVTNKSKADTQMQIATRLAVVEAVHQGSGGDCDDDGTIEPLPPQDAGSSPAPLGGGHLPAALGAAQLDPWGTPYGYCAWNHGALNADNGCSGNLLAGTNYPDARTRTALAIISAGPDRRFDTMCGPHPVYVDRNGDDLVMAYTYAEAIEASGGLWVLKSGEPTTATIDRDVEVQGAFRMGLAGDDPGFVGTSACLGPQHINRMRYNSFDEKIEVCSFVSPNYVWRPISSLELWALHDNQQDIFYTDGNVGIGTADPQTKLHIREDIAGTVVSALYLQNRTVGGSGQGMAIDFDNSGTGEPDARINSLRIASSQAPTALVFSVKPLSGNPLVEAMRIMPNGNVGIGTSSPSNKLDVRGDITLGAQNASAATIQPTPAQGVDVDGAHLVLRAGRTTGSGMAGEIRLFPSADSANSGDTNRGNTTKGLYLQFQRTGWDAHPNLFALNAVLGDSSARGNKSGLGDGAVVLTLAPNHTAPGVLELIGRSNGSHSDQGFISFFGSSSEFPMGRIVAKMEGNQGNLTGGLAFRTRDAGVEHDRLRLYGSGVTTFSAHGIEHARINPNGHVGIGTTNPQELLHVAGTARIEAIWLRQNSTGASEYSLEELYNMTDHDDLAIGIADGRPHGLSNNEIIFMNADFNGASPDDGISFVNYGTSGPAIAMRIRGNGRIGIGTENPSYLLHVEGTAYATGAAGELSDRRHKKDIHDLDLSGLATVERLRPVSYHWKAPADPGMDGEQFGFIAQEIEEILPQIVLTHGEGEAETKGIKPTALIPVLVKAVQELKALIEDLIDRLAELFGRVDAQDRRIAELEAVNAELRLRLEVLEGARAQ